MWYLVRFCLASLLIPTALTNTLISFYLWSGRRYLWFGRLFWLILNVQPLHRLSTIPKCLLLLQFKLLTAIIIITTMSYEGNFYPSSVRIPCGEWYDNPLTNQVHNMYDPTEQSYIQFNYLQNVIQSQIHQSQVLYK